MSESDSTLAAVIATVADTFVIDGTSLDAATVAEDVDGWDSVSHTMFLLALEDRFGITLSFEETIAQPNLGAMAAYIDSRARG